MKLLSAGVDWQPALPMVHGNNPESRPVLLAGALAPPNPTAKSTPLWAFANYRQRSGSTNRGR
jgi:hypothetical protein